MARGRFSRGAPLRQGQRRAVGWSRAPSGLASVTQGTKILFPGSQVLLVEKATITRILGSLSLGLVVQDAANRDLQVAVGIINVEAQAFSVGVTAVPDPLTDPQEHWLWAYYGAPWSEAANPGPTDVPAHQFLQFDVKGQQKVRVGDVLAAVLVLTMAAGTGTVQATLNSRVLDKLV